MCRGAGGKCGNEAHAPATCKQMVEWHFREMGESDNLAYIKAHTKPCPDQPLPLPFPLPSSPSSPSSSRGGTVRG